MCKAESEPGGPKQCDSDSFARAEQAAADAAVARSYAALLSSQLEEAKARVAELEAQLAQMRWPATPATAPPGAPDTLRRPGTHPGVDRGGRRCESMAEENRPLVWSTPHPARTFDRDVIRPVGSADRVLGKPTSGLWVAPIDDDHPYTGYEEVRGCNDYDSTAMYRTTIGVAADARVFRCRSLEDLQYLQSTYPDREHPGDDMPDPLPNELRIARIDWPALGEDYDVFHLTTSGLNATCNSTPMLAAWDCESLVVLNPDSVTTVGESTRIEPPPPSDEYDRDWDDDNDFDDSGWEDLLKL